MPERLGTPANLWPPERQREEAPEAAVEATEAECHRCGGPNMVWWASSPLWNAVMRGGSINGRDEFDGIVCPTCFAVLAEQKGMAANWKLDAETVHVALETVTPSGRVWDGTYWRDPPLDPSLGEERLVPYGQARAEVLEAAGVPALLSQREGLLDAVERLNEQKDRLLREVADLQSIAGLDLVESERAARAAEARVTALEREKAQARAEVLGEVERLREALEEIAEHGERYKHRTEHLHAVALKAREALESTP